MRLDKFLSNSGVATRSISRKIIKSKKIFVNDSCIIDPAYNIDEISDIVTYNNNIVNYKPYIYVMLNKPKGVISASFDKKLKTVVDLLNGNFKTYKLFPIGRLDIDTEGLIILTNDGILSHNLLSPKKHVIKMYYVEYKNILSNEDIKKLETGIDIGGYITKSDAKVEVLSSSSCNLTISEGKFHQIKKMFHSLDNEVTFLKRIKMNKLKLDENLKLGEFRELTFDELKLLKD